MRLNRPGIKARRQTRISLPVNIMDGWNRRTFARQIGRRPPPAAIASDAEALRLGVEARPEVKTAVGALYRCSAQVWKRLPQRQRRRERQVPSRRRDRHASRHRRPRCLVKYSRRQPCRPVHFAESLAGPRSEPGMSASPPHLLENLLEMRPSLQRLA